MNHADSDYPVDAHGLLHRDRARAAGFTDHRLREDVRAERLRRIARGVYLPTSPVDDDADSAAARAVETFRLTSIAVACAHGPHPTAVLSHESAAALHDLPMLRPRLDKVHLTNGEIGGGRTREASILHASELAPGDVVEVAGIPVTSLGRTAADVAQMTPSTHPLAFARALVVFDAALRRGELPESLALHLHRRRRRGTRAAKEALAYADPGAESVGESWGRAQMIVADLPVPTLQVEHTIDGQKYRVDGEWDGRLVWEFDGRTKYHRHCRPGESAADVVVREKDREDALRAAGLMVVRTSWTDLERHTMVPTLRHWLRHFGLH